MIRPSKPEKELSERLQEIESYLSTPERLRPLYPPVFSIPVSKISPGRSESIDTRKRITAFMKLNLEFAKGVDSVLQKAKEFSLKNRKIKDIRRDISLKVFGSEKRNRDDVSEWLRNHYKKLHRKKPLIRKSKTPCQ